MTKGSKVAASMQAEAEAEKRRLGRVAMAIQVDASGARAYEDVVGRHAPPRIESPICGQRQKVAWRALGFVLRNYSQHAVEILGNLFGIDAHTHIVRDFPKPFVPICRPLV
jgi:hypothetical protein